MTRVSIVRLIERMKSDDPQPPTPCLHHHPGGPMSDAVQLDLAVAVKRHNAEDDARDRRVA